jgi:hypothetical protein
VTVHAAGSDYDSVIQSWNVSSQYELFERISSEAESLAKEAFQQIQMKAKKKSSRSNQAVISHTDHTSFEHIRWYTLSEELEEMPVASLDFDDDLPLLELKGLNEIFRVRSIIVFWIVRPHCAWKFVRTITRR